ncbi:MAG: fimbria major subunit [Muribaculaceae bacterium]|nr:fimbria major subunit [Muribaculaceae bacterium]
MKLNKWLYGAAALAMLAACSDKDIAPNGGGDEGISGNGEAMDGYLAVQINLPQETGTRAPNDVFDDGTANEYQVDNAMIIVFKGADEKTAKFYKAQDLKKPFFTNMPENDGITSSYQAAIQVSKTAGDTDSFWGLVILNRNTDTTDVGVAEEEEGPNSVMIAGQSFSTDSKFEDILKAMTSNSFLTVTGTNNDTKEYSNFFMTNAPLSENRGGTDNPGTGKTADGKNTIHYLVNLGKDTYPTIDEAKKNITTCIYVERAVAKVTCSQGEDPFKLEFYDGNGNKINDLKVDATIRYALTNTNKKSYVIRNVEFTDQHFAWNLFNVNKYRMVGELAMDKLKIPYHDKEQNFFRTYWCIDPNYGSAMKKDEKNMISKAEEFTSISQPLYCKENTFTVEHQNYANTTLAVFQVDYVIRDKDGNTYGDGNLYTKDGDNTKIYASAQTAAAEEITRIKNDKDILDALLAAEKASGVTGTIENATQYLEITFKTVNNMLLINTIGLNEAAGAFNTNGVKEFNKYMGDGTVDSSKMAELIKSVNAMNDITQYTGGISYYTIPIMHFGETYCPWDDKIVGTTTQDVYNNKEPFDFAGAENNEHAIKYLGRYGMVRNNWYDLNITEIKALDSPTVPDNDINLSDDNNEEKKYIGVEIHVLSWAKRTQGVKF